MSPTALRRTWRQHLRHAVLCIAAASLLLPAPASAAEPTIVNDIVLVVTCGTLTTNDGSLQLSLSVPNGRETDASMAYWEPGSNPAVDDPTLIGFASITLRQASPTRIEGDLDVFRTDETENFLAPVSVDLAPAGPADAFSVDDRFGNVTTRMTFATEPMTVTAGSITLGDRTFTLTSCEAIRGTAGVWQTAPTATMVDGSTTDIECTWQSGGLSAVHVGQQTPFETEGALFVETPDGMWAAGGPATIADGQFLGELELFGTSGGSARISVALASTGLQRTYVQLLEDTRTRITDSILSASGGLKLTTEAGLTIDLSLANAACQAVASDFHGVMRSSNEAVHPAPVNDAPDAAETLGKGGVATAHTGGAAFEGEARSECIKVDGEINPFVHTVWYAVIGTGSVVTIDTAGSDFDTGVAIYVRNTEGGFDEVACSNNVPLEPLGTELQARVSFESDAGTTYYVQAGGFLVDSGHLTVRAS